MKTFVAVLARRRSLNAAVNLSRTQDGFPCGSTNPKGYVFAAATPGLPGAFLRFPIAAQHRDPDARVPFCAGSPVTADAFLCTPLSVSSAAAERRFPGQRLAVTVPASVQRERSRKRSRLRGNLGPAPWEALFGVFCEHPSRREGSCRGRRLEFAGGETRRCRNLLTSTVLGHPGWRSQKNPHISSRLQRRLVASFV